MTNLNDSILDKSIAMQKQESIKSNNLHQSPKVGSAAAYQAFDGFANNSENNLKAIGDGRADSNPFADFDYAHPPLGEIQILRVLENHIKRKKRAQLDKARKFKEQILAGQH